MTIADYLNSLVLTNGEKLVWNRDRLTQQQMRIADGNPYVVMTMGSERPAQRYHQGMIMRRLISLLMYVEPLPSDHLPSRAELERLYGSLKLAPEYVDEGLYDHDIIKLEYVGGFAPNLSERSSGLSAAVRFSWWYSMQLNPKV